MIKDNDNLTDKKEKTDEEIRKSKDQFMDIIINKFDKDLLERYLGDIIIKCYKKDDPKKQSLWSSDTSRLTYVVRELMNNKKIDWAVDKKGIKTKTYIINPLLDYIDDLMREYIDTYSITDINKIDMRFYEIKLLKMNKLTEIICAINNGKLAEGIIGYVAPEFFLNKECNVPAIEN